ncbi:hypothetical protein GB937_004478 [Aspergillus fischeri]|nr:hypothetical protein GB937_004478 [Aspergillus fischeri]
MWPGGSSPVLQSEIKAISIRLYADDSNLGAGRVSKSGDSTPIWPDGSAAWSVTGQAAKTIRTQVHQALPGWKAPTDPLDNRAFDMCGYAADLADEPTGHADVDWFHGYNFPTMAELPNRPYTSSSSRRRLYACSGYTCPLGAYSLVLHSFALRVPAQSYVETWETQ